MATVRLITYGLLMASFGLTTATRGHRNGQLSKAISILQHEEGDISTIMHTRYPRRVDAGGNFISYVTLDAPLGNIVENPKRRVRRSATEHLDAAAVSEDGDHEIYLEMDQVFDMPKARLHLKKNYKLVSKNLVIEVRGRGGKIVSRHSEVDDCHYTGTINNHDGYSKIAVSLCEGMQGIISKDDADYLIEPQWNHTAVSRNSSENFTSSTTSSPFLEEEYKNEEALEGHPHVIYKRSVLRHLQERTKDKDDLGHCGYSDKYTGETPWWRVDPHKQNEDEDDDDLKEKVESNTESQTSSRKRKSRRHHHDKKKRRDSGAGRSKPISDVDEDSNRVLSRRKRSVSAERNVETLVVADKMMVGYHGRQEVERYILTIMNIVANLYHDASIGNAINVIVTRIVLLTEDQPDLEINHYAERSLNSFCKWQHQINVNESSDIPESGIAHHDNAVLITGFDICTYENKPCGTLGLAPVKGMCEHDRSCNINEDIGLASAFTIAHEIGHNFGMQHDGSGNDCGTLDSEPAQIMADQLTKNTRPFTWSRCSRKYITDFLDTGAGRCLTNTPPRRDFVFPAELPGQQHNADEQCRFQYGPQSKQCNYGQACRELWCVSQNGRCVTNSIPAAEGTNCQDKSRRIERGWCYQGQCVPFGLRPNSVDGGWGDWSTWGDCSRTCGGGVSSSFRHCDSPAPEHGGKYCIGQRRRYRSCSAEKCTSTDDYRQQQCTGSDDVPFQAKFYTWVPYDGGHNVNPCALNCLAQGYSFYTERASAVVDGTRCFPDSLDMCINGECHHVGCDGVLHSEAVEDKCRVCGGDGSTCETVHSIFDSAGLQGHYEEIVTIPKGAVHIYIRETVQSRNYLAMRNTKGKNYVNGNYTIDWPRKFEIAGTTFTYERTPYDPEVLKALGPTTEDLVITVLLQEPNKGIQYEYNVPIERTTSGDDEVQFIWDLGDWSDCSATCAGGTQRSPVICKRADDATVVQHSYCNPDTMPTEKVQPCNLEPCEPQWSIGQWQPCSATCGGGERTRVASCQRKLSASEDEIIDDKLCSGEKPIRRESCNTDICPPQWVAKPWSQCNVKCGMGWKKRDVHCMSSDKSERYPNSRCNARHKPPTGARCSAGQCPPPRWHTGKWGKCNTQCGHGRQMRRVVCLTHERRRSSQCSTRVRPSNSKSCHVKCATEAPTSFASQNCVDDKTFGHCALVRKFKFCSRTYFRKMCCNSCST